MTEIVVDCLHNDGGWCDFRYDNALYALFIRAHGNDIWSLDQWSNVVEMIHQSPRTLVNARALDHYLASIDFDLLVLERRL